MDKTTYEILKKVNSPFTDEGIKKLIELYYKLENYGDVYKAINCIGLENDIISERLQKTITFCYNQKYGVESKKYIEISNRIKEIEQKYYVIDEEWQCRVLDEKRFYADEEVQKLFEELRELENKGLEYEINPDETVDIRETNYWMFVKKEFERKDKELIRIYVNVKGEAKEKLIKRFVNRCIEQKLPYQFKFSMQENRRDEVIIISDLETISKHVEIVNEITEDLEVGELPILIGKYNEKIGIVSDNEERSGQSFNQKRITILEVALEKYVLDHLEQILPLCDEDERKVLEREKASIDSWIEWWKKSIKSCEESLENAIKNADTKEITGCKQIIAEYIESQNNFKENLFIKAGGRIYSDKPEVLSIIKRKIQYKPEELEEIIANYRLVSERVGISRNGIYTTSLEEEIEKAEMKYRTDSATFRTTLAEGVPTLEKQAENSKKFQEEGIKSIINTEKTKGTES